MMPGMPMPVRMVRPVPMVAMVPGMPVQHMAVVPVVATMPVCPMQVPVPVCSMTPVVVGPMMAFHQYALPPPVNRLT